jgi:hypothetical protein
MVQVLLHNLYNHEWFHIAIWAPVEFLTSFEIKIYFFEQQLNII